MQYVKKKINHNAVLIEENGIEKVAMGKGIGFSLEPNQVFNEEVADKVFILDTKEKTKIFSELTSQIPLEYIDFAEEMISFIKSKIKVSLDSLNNSYF